MRFIPFVPADISGYRPGVPLLLSLVPAGFPSPSDGYVEEEMDLHRILIPNPESTILLEAVGDSMIHANLVEGDRLIVDCSLTPMPGRIVIAAVDGEFTVKRLIKRRGRYYLKPENDGYPERDITDDENVEIRGVVTYIIHKA